jgi:heme-degrading monooxygenase HmoA
MTFKPEAVEDFLKIFKNSEDKIRKMPGCCHLELWKDIDHPNIFTTFSKWDSAEDLNNYRNSQVFVEVWPKTKLLFLEKPNAFSSEEVDKMDNVNFFG